MTENSAKNGKVNGRWERGGVEDLPAKGYGQVRHWVWQGTVAEITKSYGPPAALVWLCITHAVEGHHAKKAAISQHEIKRATGLSRDAVVRALGRMLEGGELRVLDYKPNVTAVYEVAARELETGKRWPVSQTSTCTSDGQVGGLSHVQVARRNALKKEKKEEQKGQHAQFLAETGEKGPGKDAEKTVSMEGEEGKRREAVSVDREEFEGLRPGQQEVLKEAAVRWGAFPEGLTLREVIEKYEREKAIEDKGRARPVLEWTAAMYHAANVAVGLARPEDFELYNLGGYERDVWADVYGQAATPSWEGVVQGPVW